MKNRPGEHARQTIRTAWFRTIRKNVVLWLSLVLLVALFFVVISALPMPDTWRAFLAGFGTASGLACFAWMVVALSGTHGRTLGKLGEEATVEAVLGWRQRRKGWRVINGLLLDGNGDIDHVLVCPGGIYVIESKWTSKPCRIEQGRVRGLVGREPVSQARTGARNVERMLLRHGPPYVDATVRSVVVLWGPGSMHLDQGCATVGGVLVCEGRKKKMWLGRLDGSVLDQAMVEAIAGVLEQQVGRQNEKTASSATMNR